MLPRIGGNLISFRDEELNYHILREPTSDEWDNFVQRPMVHGIPVLFPPNRFEDGKISFGGHDYQFPINEPQTNNHLHGFVYNQPWETESYGCDPDKSYVTIKHRFNESHPNFTYFPHVFTLTITYTLSDSGLTQHVHAVNEGTTALPFMIGYHTAINAPFAPGSSDKDCHALMTIGERVEMSKRMLPTGKFLTLSEGEQQLQAGTGTPYFEALDHHYTAKPQDGLNVMILTDTKAKARVVYDAGLKYSYWMVWNNQISRQYFCPEPQTNMVNAPNLSLPQEQTGLFALEPGATWTETSRIYLEHL
jgi:aldose 1-epimerase